MAYTAILFDLDGVLISTDRGVVELWQRVLPAYGIEPPVDELRVHAVGCSAEHTIEHFLGDRPAIEREAALSDVREAEPSLHFDVPAGAPALIAALQSAGISVGIVTGASQARLSRALAALSAQSSIAATVVWGDVVNGKPAPDAFLLGAERLSASPSECIAIEDSVGGVTAAVAAGCTCIAIASASHDNAEALAAAGADVVAESLLSLTLTKSYDGGHVLATDEGDFYFAPR
ncbi:MAG: Haloacid dehydrogenase/epoxide hydrolase [Frankiales bacterium]|nr:Haloacid dehydrogenase/epoxide hydrolase [Frankiales bacterium]